MQETEDFTGPTSRGVDAVDFDATVDRFGTCSMKWSRYPGDVLPMWVADMDFPSPPAVVAALEARAAHPVYGYSVVPPSLVETIRDFILARYGWSVDPDWFVWLPGVVTGLNMVCRAFADRGEAVMTVTPVYPPFLTAPLNQGRLLQRVPAEHDGSSWLLPLEAMEAAVTPATRVLLLCHPHNPLGRMWQADELRAVADFCRRHRLLLCSDEIHCDLLLDPGRHLPAATIAPDAPSFTLTLMAPSKTFNIPGLDFAFAVVPDPDMRRRFTAAGAGLLPLPGCFAIAGAEAAYRDGLEWLERLLRYLRGNRDHVESFVRDRLPGVTMSHVEATYLAWLDTRRLGLADPAAACERGGVALSDGCEFDGAGFLRLNFGCPRDVLTEGLRRLEAALTGG